MRQHPSPAGARASVIALPCALALCIAPFAGVPVADAHLHLNLNQIAGLRESDLVFGLTAAGLAPEALAAAGVDDEGATAVVAAAASYLGNSPSTLASAVRAAGTASAEVDRLERLVRRGAGVSPEALSAAREDKADAQATLDSYINSLRAVAVAPLSSGERAMLNAIRPNLGRTVPAQYLVVERSEADWTALRDALANEAQASAGITAADQPAATLLETARGNELVASAQSGLANHLQAINDAYYSAVETLGE